jgi:hypothetical protein
VRKPPERAVFLSFKPMSQRGFMVIVFILWRYFVKIPLRQMTKLLFLLLLFGNVSFGQATIRGVTTISTDSIYSDSVYNSPNIAFNNKIKLEQIDKSIAKVDIRLYKLFELSNTKSVRRLFLVDTTWRAVEFDEWNKPNKIKKYKLTATLNFDSLLLLLLSYNILTLPNQSDLKDKMHKDNKIGEDGYKTEKKISVIDGESYTIEIKIGNKFRAYQFDNPDVYSKFYNNVLELQNYLNIVQAFDKFLDRK